MRTRNPTRRPLAAACTALACGAVAPRGAEAQQLTYPTARADTTRDVYFGLSVPAPYQWLADTASTEAHTWREAEQRLRLAYAAASPLNGWLESRLAATTPSTIGMTGTPKRAGDRIFFTLAPTGSAAPVLYAKEGVTGSPHPLLDSARSGGRLVNYRPSGNGRYLAYEMTDAAGNDFWFRVRDLATGRDLPDSVGSVNRFSSVSWSLDGRGFIYDRPQAGKQPSAGAIVGNEAYYHEAGTPQSEDRLIYRRTDLPDDYVGAGITESGRYLIINLWSTVRGGNRLFVADLGDPIHPDVSAPIRPLLTQEDASYIWLREVHDTLYIQANKDAPNGEIVAVPLREGPDPEVRTVIPEGPTRIWGSTVVGERLAVSYVEDGHSRIRLFDLHGESLGDVPLPGPGYASGLTGRKDTGELFYAFTSSLRPNTIFRFDLDAGTNKAFEPPSLPFDAERYETKAAFVTSNDGTRVPIFVTAAKDVVRDGSHPTALFAYGAFGTTLIPRFRDGVVPWLELGGVYVEVCVRGGGERGEAWHRAGMREHKQDGIDDFIAAAEWVIAQGYTSPTHLAALTSTAGAAVVAGALTQRPELFGAAHFSRGLFDMLTYDRSGPGAGWAGEFGSASDSTAFPYLLSYSPLQNVHRGTCYPATMASVSLPEGRNPPASQSYRFIARLQAAQSCDRPVLLRVDRAARQGAAGPESGPARRLAEIWSFLARNAGVAGPPSVGR